MAIPKSFECMGFTVTVEVKDIDKENNGHFHGQTQLIEIDKTASKQMREQTFWHEFMHCALTNLGYEELNSNEQFVDQMGQCLYQLQKTRK